MKSASQDYVDVNINTYGAGDLNRLLPFEYHGKIAKEITNMGEQFKNIHKDSISLKDQATLFQAYLLSEEGRLELPGDVKEVLKYLFEDMKGHGNVTDDACNYNNGDKGMKKVKESDRRVQWIRHPKEFVETDEGWKAKLGEDSEVKNILIPGTGYNELTCDGLIRPDTGTYFSTVKTRKEAEKSFTDKGFSSDFAKKAVSYFYSREEGNGTASVDRWCDDDDYGRFDVSAVSDPDDRDSVIGSFASSRQPSGARQTTDKGIVVMSENDYKLLVGTSKKLSEQIGTLNK
jgi:hypothetical protein